MRTIEHMTRCVKLIAAAAVVALVAGQAAAQSRPPERRAAPAKPSSGYKPPPTRTIEVTNEMLREAGVAVQSQTVPGFPHKCYDNLVPGQRGLTVSDQLLGAMRAKGFTLETLCLGLTSPWVTYHVETGRALTVATTTRPLRGSSFERTRGYTFLLDLPNCLKNGTPYLDCTFTYAWDSGSKESGDATARIRQNGRKIDEAIKHVMARGGYSKACECSDLEVDQNPRTVITDNKGGRATRAFPQFRAKPDAFCFIDIVPPCAQQMSKGMVQTGHLWIDLTGNDLARMLSKRNNDIGILNEDFDISPRLPRGYAHRIMYPEGDDDRGYAPISPGSRVGVSTE